MIAKRVGLSAAAALVTVNIWTGAPLLALVWLLARINERYDRLTGRPEADRRRTSPWLRSMRSEREDALRAKHGTSAIERVVVIIVGVAVLAFNVWFFFFAGSPLASG